MNTDQIIELSKTGRGRVDKRPYHLVSEYGCSHGQRMDTGSLDLNFVEHGDNIETTHWDDGFHKTTRWVHYTESDRSDDGRYTIESVFDLIICDHCTSALEFWHTQRQIFLPQLADELTLDTVDVDSFERHDIHHGSCDTCGTPRSATATLPEDVEIEYVDYPIALCPTCRELLSKAESELSIDRLELRSHPKNRPGEINVTTPITDPKYDPHEESGDNQHAHLKNLSKDEFVSIVEGFDSISTGSAERVYDLGITGIPQLKEASYAQLTEANFVGRVTAEQLQDGAETHLNNIDS